MLIPAGASHAGDGKGTSMLTPRELEAVRLVGGGLSNAEIAARLSVTVKTVEKHVGSVYEKLGSIRAPSLWPSFTSARLSPICK